MLQALPPQDPPGQLIVVTGEALPFSLAERSFPKDVLDRSDLQNAAAHPLDEIMKQAAGVQLFRRSDSTSGHPTSQGVTLRGLGGNASSRALLMLDGVPQADPFGGWVNWPAYDPSGLDQVRILRGAGHVAAGSGAMAGLIEMHSRVSDSLNASLEAGSRQSLYGHAYAGEKLGSGLVTADMQGARGDGFVPTTRQTRGPIDSAAPYREASLRLRWVAPIGNDTEIQLGGFGFIDERDRGLPFTGNRTRGGDASVRIVGRGDWQWIVLGYGQLRNLRSSFASVDDGRLTAARVSLQDSVPSSAIGGGLELRPPTGNNIELRLGADMRFMRGESRELANYINGVPGRRRIAGGDASTIGMFAELSATRGALTASAAARVDRWRISDGILFERNLLTNATTRNDQFPSRRGWQPTLRIAGTVEVTKGFDIRAAAYRSWRLPTLNELFRPFRVGGDATAANPLLDPEKLAGVEAGIDYRRGIFDLSFTLFVNRLNGAIANVTLGHGPGVFPGVGFVAGEFRQRQNLKSVYVLGSEASAVVKRGNWSFQIGTSYTQSKVEAEGLATELDGLRPAQTPNLIVAASVGWERNRRSASISLRRVGAQFEDDLNRRSLRGATTLDAFFAWPLSRGLQLVARGQNLLDTEVMAGISDDGAVERTTPRTVWVGLRLDGR